MLIKLQGSACNFIKKEILEQVPSCEFLEILKNIYFTEQLRTTAPVQNIWVSASLIILEKYNWKPHFVITEFVQVES